ncbi:MAG: Sir2 family NAD-dependent protein deacetylase [Planctomycetota bacterium]
MQSVIEQTRTALQTADRILIGAGAGMGVDSGLPDFRGNEGFWKAYPPFKESGLSFQDLANPRWFDVDSPRAWGFYGHRLNLYRETQPHAGFTRLLQFLRSQRKDFFVFTSNVDGHFQRAGYPIERMVECHGSIHHLQCIVDCENEIWENDCEIEVDESFRAGGTLPSCPKCELLARPNILMFGDFGWNASRSTEQEKRFQSWLTASTVPITALEFGAGTAIPSVRMECEAHSDTLIRVNPRESDGHPGTISIPLGAREAIERIVSF